MARPTAAALDDLKTKKQLSVFDMRLSEDDVNLFYKLNPALLLFVNLRLGLQKEVVNIKNFLSLQLEKKVEVRNALYDNIDVIDEFVEKNPDNFSLEELDIPLSQKARNKQMRAN